jgi:glutathione S-transferase
MTMIRVSALRWVPPFAQGLVRDFRVRWALEEASLAYEPRLIGPEDQTSVGYRGLQPFGQVPAMRRTGWCCSSPAPSCCMSPSGAPR